MAESKKCPSESKDLSSCRQSILTESEIVIYNGNNIIKLCDTDRHGMHVVKQANGNIVNAIRDACFMMSLDHPNIQKILYCMRTEATRFVIGMNLCPADTHTIISSGLELDIKTFKNWCYQAANALVYLHDRRIIHGDIKPSNFLISAQNSASTVLLTDFEHACFNPIRTLRFDIYHYTMTMRAPEVWNRQGWDMPADIWALGQTFYAWWYRSYMVPTQHKDGKLVPDGPHASSLYQKAIDTGTKKLSQQLEATKLSADNDLIMLHQLLVSMLRINPSERATAHEVLTHPFFHDCKSVQPIEHKIPTLTRDGKRKQLTISSQYTDVADELCYILFDNKCKYMATSQLIDLLIKLKFNVL